MIGEITQRNEYILFGIYFNAQYSGFDRGHLAPAANHRLNQEVCNETFLLSNMAPQVKCIFWGYP